jgi:predicted PhzF superfamily epimerase YddE/YHI9
MTPLRYLHLDVFASGPSGGHPLIVCLDQCPASAMPALSHEFGLVVAFPVVTSRGGTTCASSSTAMNCRSAASPP